MAQTQDTPTMRQSDLVDRWKADSYVLIGAATDYVSKGEPDESASANIREISVVVAALQAAVQQAQNMTRTLIQPPMPEPPAATPAPPQFNVPPMPASDQPPPPLPPAA